MNAALTPNYRYLIGQPIPPLSPESLLPSPYQSHPAISELQVKSHEARDARSALGRIDDIAIPPEARKLDASPSATKDCAR